MNPQASSTYLAAMRINPPLTGIYTVISAMQLLTIASTILWRINASSKLAGPDSLSVEPMVTKMAVPIEPPMAISWIWRLPRVRWRPLSMLLPDMVPVWVSDGQVAEGSGCCMGFSCSGFSSIALVLLGLELCVALVFVASGMLVIRVRLW